MTRYEMSFIYQDTDHARLVGAKCHMDFETDKADLMYIEMILLRDLEEHYEVIDHGMVMQYRIG